MAVILACAGTACACARACVRERKGEEEGTEEMFEEVEFLEEIWRYMFMFFRCKIVQSVYYSK